MLFSKKFLFVAGCLTTFLPGNVLSSSTIKEIACGDPNFSVACSLIDSCAGPSSSDESSSHDDPHEETKIPDFEDMCVDANIGSVEECGATASTFCNAYGVDDIYMSTYHFESGDSGPKYCVVKCVEDGTRWEICGGQTGSYSHSHDEDGMPMGSHDNDPDHVSLPGTEECGACKHACHDNETEDAPAGPCKGNCMDSFGYTNCMCGNDRCTESSGSHSHDGDASSDSDHVSLPGTEECGVCKHACHDNETEDAPSGPCKGNCMDTFGYTNCMCGNDRCTESSGSHSHDGDAASASSDTEDAPTPETRRRLQHGLPGTEECGECKHACADADSESTPSGPCKGNCMDTFGYTNCMCGDDLCTESSGSHSHDGDVSSSSSDDSHTHGHDPTELAGTHYEDTRPCGACKSSCSTDTPEFIETEDAGCKSQCHTAYDPFCTCGGQVCGDGFEGAEGPYTVFLPTDEAFADLDAAVGGLANVEPEVLCGILEFHVVAEKALSSSDLSCETGDDSLIEMANGLNTRVKCSKDVPYGIKGGGNDTPANFVDVDIQASDGYVHVIDNVLFYPAVLDSPFGQTSGGENVVPSFRGYNPSN